MAPPEESGRPGGVAGGVAGAVRRSALLSLAALGALVVLAGYAIHTGVWAAILAVWGGALVCVGVVGYGLVWLARR